MILLGLIAAISLPAPGWPPQDTVPFTVAVRFSVTDTTPVFERPLGASLLIRVQHQPPFGWTVTVVPRASRLDRPNLLYHSRSWHGPYPTDVFAWSHQQHYFPDERLLPVYGYPYEIRIRLIDCRTSGSGEAAVFETGTIEVAWRPAPVLRAGGA